MDNNHYNESGVDVVVGLTKAENDNQTRTQAIRCLGNMAMNKQARSFLLEKYGLDLFIQMYNNTTQAIQNQSNANPQPLSPLLTANTSNSNSNNNNSSPNTLSSSNTPNTNNDLSSSETKGVKRQLNRLLNILGAHNFLHFPIQRTRGIRILTLDGGGTRALTTLEILKKMEELSGQRIPDMFDMIAGTSTGGILASLIGIRGYTLDKCEALYKDLSRKVFAIGSSPESDPSTWSRLINYTYLIKSGAFYKSKVLLDVLSANCGAERMIDTTMDERVKNLKVFFVSTLVSQTPPLPFLFRNYDYPATATATTADGNSSKTTSSSSKSRYLGDYSTQICYALRASTAAPSYFEEWESKFNEKHQDGK